MESLAGFRDWPLKFAANPSGEAVLSAGQSSEAIVHRHPRPVFLVVSLVLPLLVPFAIATASPPSYTRP